MTKKRYSCIRFFTIGHYEKEEQWLNSMAAKGMFLVDAPAFIWYTFEEDTPNLYRYRLELMKKGRNHSETIAYIRFLEDLDIEVVGFILNWMYLRKKTVDGDFLLFSDIDSKINHYNRILRLSIFMIVPAILNLIVFFVYQQMINGITVLLIALIYILVTIPVRKSVNRLKKQKNISE